MNTREFLIQYEVVFYYNYRILHTLHRVLLCSQSQRQDMKQRLALLACPFEGIFTVGRN